MASSGSVTVAVTTWDKLVFSWSLSSQSVGNNSSTVTWALRLVSTSNGRINSSASKSWSVTVNGTTYRGSNTVGISNNSSKTLASGTTVIKHLDDGSKSFNYSFSQEFSITFSGETIGTISGSGSGTLDTIARASQPSCITWPEHTQNVGDFGTEISIHMNRKSSNFTHTVRYGFHDVTGTIATGVTTGIKWTIPLSLMNKIPNQTSGWGTIYVDTYNGSTKIGTKTCIFTASVPSGINPSCQINASDTAGALSKYGFLIQGISKLSVAITATTQYGAAIDSYSSTANGSKYTTASFVTSAIKSAGTLAISTTVKDTRGRTGSATKSIQVVEYQKPAVTKLDTRRCNSDGSANQQGEYISVTYSGKISTVEGENGSYYYVRYKKTTEDTYTQVTHSSGTYNVTDKVYIFAADTGSSYDIEVVAADSYNSTTRSTSASTAFTLMHLGADGESLAIGKVSEKSGYLEVGLPMENLQSHIQVGNRYSMSSPGVANATGYVHVAQITLTAANADTPITFVLTRRREEGPMTVHLQLRNSAGTTGYVESVTYEGSNYGAYMASNGDDKTTWNLYVEKGSSWDTITLQDWWMSKTMESRAMVAFPGTLITELPAEFWRATPYKSRCLLDFIYPVDSIYLSFSHKDPATLFGGTWTRLENTFLWAIDANGEIGITGGEKTHTLTVEELPTHTHAVAVANTATGTTTASNKIRYNNNATSYVGTIASNETGGGKAHNNMPPYIQVSAWRRIA